MKLFKGYKGVALIYLVLTIINVVWIVNYEKPSSEKQVSATSDVVLNS